MPPKSQKLIEQEGIVVLTISAINKSQISSIRQAARHFQVPESTLHRRLHGIQTRTETRAKSNKLTENEEESLLNWILYELMWNCTTACSYSRYGQSSSFAVWLY